METTTDALTRVSDLIGPFIVFIVCNLYQILTFYLDKLKMVGEGGLRPHPRIARMLIRIIIYDLN